MLDFVSQTVGTNGITDGNQLDKIAKRLFGKKYIGVYPIKTTRDVPVLKEGQIAILNRDVHWFGAFKKNGKLYESDSYNLDQLGPQYKDKKVERPFVQRGQEANCGQRLIVNLLFDIYKKQ